MGSNNWSLPKGESDLMTLVLKMCTKDIVQQRGLFVTNGTRLGMVVAVCKVLKLMHLQVMVSSVPVFSG